MDLWRQLDILSPDDVRDLNVTVIGAGGIGSPTALALSKMGISSITVYDDDTTEAHNIPNQFYRNSDVGKPKVEALADIIKDYSGAVIEAKNQLFKNQSLSGIVISGVDSMKARKEIWGKIKYNPNIRIYIEARMGAEVARIHTVRPCDPTDVVWYEGTLYSDENSVEDPCTHRAIIYCTLMIASLIASQVKKVIKYQPFNKEVIFDLVTLSLLLN